MHKRILTLSALLVVFFAGSVWLTTDALAADPSPSHSTLAPQSIPTRALASPSHCATRQAAA